jgi:hypothetical protein
MASGEKELLKAARCLPGPGLELIGSSSRSWVQHSILLQRDVLFVGTATGILRLPKDARCGGAPGDGIDPGDPSSAPSASEQLDIPYSCNRPAINKGVAINGVDADYDGNAYQDPPSIGAYER